MTLSTNWEGQRRRMKNNESEQRREESGKVVDKENWTDEDPSSCLQFPSEPHAAFSFSLNTVSLTEKEGTTDVVIYVSLPEEAIQQEFHEESQG